MSKDLLGGIFIGHEAVFKTIDAVSGKEVAQGEGKASNRMVNFSVGISSPEEPPRPSCVIDGVKYLFPPEARWVCFEKNLVVYWSKRKLKHVSDEFTGEVLGWSPSKNPVFTRNEDGFLRSLQRKASAVDPSKWTASLERLKRAETMFLQKPV